MKPTLLVSILSGFILFLASLVITHGSENVKGEACSKCCVRIKKEDSVKKFTKIFDSVAKEQSATLKVLGTNELRVKLVEREVHTEKILNRGALVVNIKDLSLAINEGDASKREDLVKVLCAILDSAELEKQPSAFLGVQNQVLGGAILFTQVQYKGKNYVFIDQATNERPLVKTLKAVIKCIE